MPTQSTKKSDGASSRYRGERIGEWHLRVLKGDDKTTSTTWPLPLGPFWEELNDKLVSADYIEGGVRITSSEARALRSLIHAYKNAFDQPRERTRIIARSLDAG